MEWSTFFFSNCWSWSLFPLLVTVSFSKVRSGEAGPAPAWFESPGILRSRQAAVLGSEPLTFEVLRLKLARVGRRSTTSEDGGGPDLSPVRDGLPRPTSRVRPFILPRSCMFEGLTQSGSYFQGVNSLKIQAIP